MSQRYKTVNANTYYGCRIQKAWAEDSEEYGYLHLEFEDGCHIVLKDDGRACCESRWVSCDDDPRDLVGHELVGIEERDGGEENVLNGDVHERMLVDVCTDVGRIQLVTYNEHNGYYGGFNLKIQEVEA